MGEIALIRWLSMLLKGVCRATALSRVGCAVLVFFGWDALSTNHQMSRDERAFEREVLLRQLAEKERQAEHKRLMEIIEALKHRRDLTLPAEPDEGY
jgi:hypothetical protein